MFIRHALVFVLAICCIVQPHTISAKACAPSKAQLDEIRARIPDRSKGQTVKPMSESAKLRTSELAQKADRRAAKSDGAQPKQLQPCTTEDFKNP